MTDSRVFLDGPLVIKEKRRREAVVIGSNPAATSNKGMNFCLFTWQET